MSNLTVFTFDSDDVRVLLIKGEPWFVAKDVLKVIRSTTKVTDLEALIREDLGDEFVTNELVLDSLGRSQKMLILSEAAVTMFISRSRTEFGKKINRWIHAEVLPAIRKTGKYELVQSKFPNILDTPNVWERMYTPEFCQKTFSWRGGYFYWDWIYCFLTHEERAYVGQRKPSDRIHQYLKPETIDRIKPVVTQMLTLVAVAKGYDDFMEMWNRLHGRVQLELLMG